MRKLAMTVPVLALALGASTVFAQALPDPATIRLAQATPAKSAPSDGEVRKVDKGAGKITLRHGPIPNLDMPPMTMVFQVKDPAMLERVKAGDKVRFTADTVGGQLTLVTIEPVK